MQDNNDQSMMEVFQKEKFLAFFDICKLDEKGDSELDGLCKVAIPLGLKEVEYISLVFIFDTPSEGKTSQVKRLLSKLTSEAFKKHMPKVCAVTSVPGSVRQSGSYINQMDVVFAGSIPESEVKDCINKIVLTIRQTMMVDTEAPQWWEDSSAPAPSESEKANWGERLKAFLNIKR